MKHTDVTGDVTDSKGTGVTCNDTMDVPCPIATIHKNDENGYIDVIRDRNQHPFPQPPLPTEQINPNKNGEGIRNKNQRPIELPAIPKKETTTEENIVYDQVDYWPIGQWPNFRRSWPDRLNPLQLRNKTILIIIALVLSAIIVVVITLISRFVMIQETPSEGGYSFF